MNKYILLTTEFDMRCSFRECRRRHNRSGYYFMLNGCTNSSIPINVENEKLKSFVLCTFGIQYTIYNIHNDILRNGKKNREKRLCPGDFEFILIFKNTFFAFYRSALCKLIFQRQVLRSLHS